MAAIETTSIQAKNESRVMVLFIARIPLYDPIGFVCHTVASASLAPQVYFCPDAAIPCDKPWRASRNGRFYAKSSPVVPREADGTGSIGDDKKTPRLWEARK